MAGVRRAIMYAICDIEESIGLVPAALYTISVGLLVAVALFA